MTEILTPEDWQKTLASIQARAKRVGATLLGAQAAAAPEPPKCPTCGGSGMVRHNVPISLDGKDLNPAFGKLHPCPNPDCVEGSALRANQSTAHYKSAGLPKEYQELSFETWKKMPTEMKSGKWSAMGACTAFVQGENHYASLEAMHAAIASNLTYEDFCAELGVEGDEQARNCLVLYGAPGVGKTGLATATLNAIAALGGSVRYIRAMSLFREIKARMDADEYPKDTDVLLDFSQKFTGALVIDEVNIEDYTPARKQWLQDIVRDRVANRLPMILTCNLSREQFESAWGMWTFAPLHSKAWWIKVKGVNLRPIARTLEDR